MRPPATACYPALSPPPPTGEPELDAFLSFVEYARSELWAGKDVEGRDQQVNGEDPSVVNGEAEAAEFQGPSWSWMVSRILKTCLAYPSGVTAAILLSDLSQAWVEQNRHASLKKRLDCIVPSKKRRRRKRLPGTVRIDSIYEKNFLSTDSILEAVVVDAHLLPGTNIYMLNLGDIWSSYTIDLYLHRRYYDLVSDDGILKKGREIFLTGCCLRTAAEGYGHPRLLPTEYLVILLDEDQDEDALFLAAHFCSDNFSSICLDAFQKGTSYSFYARIESVGPLEGQGTSGCPQRKKIALTDDHGVSMNFLLWGEQVLLANLFTVGSMLAVDGPYISSSAESNIKESEKFCLEYGSATQLYVIPFVQQEEPVLLSSSSQIRHQVSSLSGATICNSGSHGYGAPEQSQFAKPSQITLPLNYEGSVDFKSYPFRMHIRDLHNKMTGFCLYGTVINLYKEAHTAKAIFVLTLRDDTGEQVVKLHFDKSWSLGRVGLGHSIFITGLICSISIKKQLEVSWFENDSDSAFVNLSLLPALLNSSCLHKLSDLSHLSNNPIATHICKVRLDEIEHHHVSSRLLHATCGHFVNEKFDGSFQCCLCAACDGEVLHSFSLEVVLVDESATLSAWCTGAIATEILQISPEEFRLLPEDEQAMYLCTFESERFIVSLVNSNPCGSSKRNQATDVSGPSWEIVHAQKLE